MRKLKRITKARAQELAHALFGPEATVTAHRVHSVTPGCSYHTMYAIRRGGAVYGSSTFGFREALRRAAMEVDRLVESSAAADALFEIGAREART